MKYKDLVMFFVLLGFIFSLAYTIGVDYQFWLIPAILFLIILILYYQLWIKK